MLVYNMKIYVNRWWRSILLFVLIWGWTGLKALAQREYFNWYFGNRAGITFNGSGPVAISNSQKSFLTGTACMSDSNGQFLFASDGAQIWDRTWQPMPGRITPHALIGFSTRQVLAVRQPGSSSRYYVFRSSNQFSQGQFPVSSQTPIYMPFVVVDMVARNGLGAIVANDSLRLPNWTLHVTAPYFYPNTNFAAIRHANGRDLWVVTQTDESQYVSYLLTATGLAPQPVVSQSIRSIFYVSNGILKASGDGKTLVSVNYFGSSTQAYTNLDVARFDPATGRVTSYYTLPNRFQGRITRTSANQWSTYFARVAGLELSPDGSKMYADTLYGSGIMQYDLLAGSPQQVAASKIDISLNARLGNDAGDMQLAPDGKIYVSMGSSEWLGRLEMPNVPGVGAGFTRQAVALGSGRSSSYTLPYATNDLNLPPVVITGAGSLNAVSNCAGRPTQFVASLSPFVAATAYDWNFGDPASGPANMAAGQAPVHVFRQPGTYTVQLRVTAPDGRVFTTTQLATILPVPVVSSATDSVICYGQEKKLTVGPQPAGTVYKWSDGSTGAELVVRSAGTYWVDVTNPQGCTTRARSAISVVDCPSALPTIITPNNDGLNETFVLPGQDPTAWSLQIYTRWGRQIYQQTRYDNSWKAEGQPAGVYYYLLHNTQTGQRYKGWVEVVR